MTFPAVSPQIVAAVLDQLPQRLRNRVDNALAKASSWSTSTVDDKCTVTVDPDTTLVFTLRDGILATDEDLTCSCLLAPRCLHRAVAVSLAPVAALEPVVVEVDEPVASLSVSLPEDAVAAADLLWQAAGVVLRAGVSGSGAVAQAELLRAVHAARLAGLHRASAAALRVVSGIRASHTGSSSFSRTKTTEDLSELLLVCHQLRAGVGDVESLLGIARREYKAIGSLKVYGLFTERVVAGSGYAGVVTHLTDADSRLWTVNGVMPGGPERVAAALDGPVGIGESGLTHRTLGRSGMLVTSATASADRRLGAGTGVRAVASRGVDWSDPPVSSLWREPVEDQVRRAFTTDNALLFLSGTVAGSTGGSLVVELPDRTIDLVGSCDTAWENLSLLASLAGKDLFVVARLVPDRPSTAVALAVTGDLTLPADWGGRVNLTLDRLQRSHVDKAGDLADQPPPPPVPSPVELLERWLHRVTLGGRRMPAIASTAPDQARLTKLGLTGTAQLLAALEASARAEHRDAFGKPVPHTDDEFILAWLRGCVHTTEFTRSTALSAWLAG